MTTTLPVTHVTRLSVPRGTRLETVFRVEDEFGQVTWHVHTACKDRNAPLNKMIGTSLILMPSGRAERYTDDEVRIDCMTVMPPAGEET